MDAMVLQGSYGAVTADIMVIDDENPEISRWKNSVHGAP